MIGTYATAAVTGTYASRADAEPTQFVGLGALSKYNAQINEGASFGRDTLYPFRYLFDDSDAVSLRVYLTQPAKGYETVTLTIGLPDSLTVPGIVYTDEGYFEAQSGVDYLQEGAFTYAFRPGELYHDIRITPVKRTQWFVERLLHVRLEQSNVQGATVLPYANVSLISIASRLTPPKLTVDCPATPVGSVFQVDFDLDAPCIDPVTVYYSWSHPDVTVFDAENASGLLTIPAGQQSKTVTFSQSTGGGVTRTITIDHERETVVAAKQQTWIDPDAGTYSVPRDIHIDENLIRRGNDIFRHGMTGSNAKRSYTAEQGIRPHVGGFPSMSLVDGAGEINHNLLGEGQSRTVVPTNTVTDPITGRAMAYMVPRDNTSGMPYVRQEFPPAYGGGPISAFDLKPWSRVAFRREFFTGSEASKNTEYTRVGYRIRVRDRNTGVVFKFRKAGAGGWGDATPAQAALTFTTDPTGEQITLTDYAGNSQTFSFGVGSPNLIPAPVDPNDMPGWAQGFAAVIAPLNPGFRIYATVDGATVTVAMDAARPEVSTATAYGGRPITYSNTAPWGSPPTHMQTPTLADGAGRYMGPASAGGSNVQYYYDTVTGVEVWFWHQYNQWRYRTGYSPGVTPNPDDAWGQWYGVTRDDAGLCLWYIHYMPTEANTTDHYRYGTVGQAGRDSDPLVQDALTVWNYNQYQSESTGSKLPDDHATYPGERGWEFADDVGNPIEYPTWIDSRTTPPEPYPAGGGRYQDGSRSGTNTLAHIRDNERGALWHSWWFETQDAQFSPMGPPPEYWPCFGNYWTPRGYAITTDPRASDSVTTT